jgi:hypothetical protein
MSTHSIDRPNLIMSRLTMSGKSPLNKGSIVTLIISVEERRSRFYLGTSIGRRDSDVDSLTGTGSIDRHAVKCISAAMQISRHRLSDYIQGQKACNLYH